MFLLTACRFTTWGTDVQLSRPSLCTQKFSEATGTCFWLRVAKPSLVNQRTLGACTVLLSLPCRLRGSQAAGQALSGGAAGSRTSCRLLDSPEQPVTGARQPGLIL